MCMPLQHLETSLLNTIVSCGKGLGEEQGELKDGSESVERGRRDERERRQRRMKERNRVFSVPRKN